MIRKWFPYIFKLLEFNYETNHITFYSNELTKGMNIHTIITNTTTLNNIKRIYIYISIYTLFLFIKYININKESFN